MNIISLILGFAAIVCFFIAAFVQPASPPRVNWTAFGLLLSIACFMAQLLILVSDPIVFLKP